MGNIRIALDGSFRPNDSNAFSAMGHGHAGAVIDCIKWLRDICLPRYAKQDIKLREQGLKPTDGFVPDLDSFAEWPAKRTIEEAAWAQLAEAAWGIIANAGEGDWNRESPTWQEAAARWRDSYHDLLNGKLGPDD